MISQIIKMQALDFFNIISGENALFAGQLPSPPGFVLFGEKVDSFPGLKAQLVVLLTIVIVEGTDLTLTSTITVSWSGGGLSSSCWFCLRRRGRSFFFWNFITSLVALRLHKLDVGSREPSNLTFLILALKM